MRYSSEKVCSRHAGATQQCHTAQHICAHFPQPPLLMHGHYGIFMAVPAKWNVDQHTEAMHASAGNVLEANLSECIRHVCLTELSLASKTTENGIFFVFVHPRNISNALFYYNIVHDARLVIFGGLQTEFIINERLCGWDTISLLLITFDHLCGMNRARNYFGENIVIRLLFFCLKRMFMLGVARKTNSNLSSVYGAF